MLGSLLPQLAVWYHLATAASPRPAASRQQFAAAQLRVRRSWLAAVARPHWRDGARALVLAAALVQTAALRWLVAGIVVGPPGVAPQVFGIGVRHLDEYYNETNE